MGIYIIEGGFCEGIITYYILQLNNKFLVGAILVNNLKCYFA